MTSFQAEVFIFLIMKKIERKKWRILEWEFQRKLPQVNKGQEVASL